MECFEFKRCWWDAAKELPESKRAELVGAITRKAFCPNFPMPNDPTIRAILTAIQDDIKVMDADEEEDWSIEDE